MTERLRLGKSPGALSRCIVPCLGFGRPLLESKQQEGAPFFVVNFE